MGNENVYQTGNTVRLTCDFFDFNGERTDPSVVRVKLYDNRFSIMREFTDVEKDENGTYYLDYVAEGRDGRYYYEWYSEIDGTPSLKRSSFVIKFV